MLSTCRASWWWEQLGRASVAVPATTSQAAGDGLWPVESRGLGCSVRKRGCVCLPGSCRSPQCLPSKMCKALMSSAVGSKDYTSLIPSTAAWL